MSRKVARRCDDCKRERLARYRALADRFLCQVCADFFSRQKRAHTTHELDAWLGVDEETARG